MNEHKVEREVKRLAASIGREFIKWTTDLEKDPEALLGPRVERFINALRGYDQSAADAAQWMLGC